MSPTQRSLNYARERGWEPDVVERYCAYSRRRYDLFGVFDLVIMDDLWGLLGVQTTSGSNVSSRIKKMKASDRCTRWLASGMRAEIWGWRKAAYYLKDGRRSATDR